MADAFYTDFFDRLGEGDIDLLAATIKVIGVDGADYTFSAAHTTIASIAAGARVGEGTLASKTLADGIFDAADTVMATVTGDPFEMLVLYQDGANDGLRYLICKLDSYTNLPYTPNGTDIEVEWPASANRIFKIG